MHVAPRGMINFRSDFAQEIWDLAEHHIDILKREFPDIYASPFPSIPKYKYGIFYDDNLENPKVWLRVEIWDDPDPSIKRIILEAAFYSSSVKIITYDRNPHASARCEIIDYADPKFTDNILHDLIKEMNEDDEQAA